MEADATRCDIRSRLIPAPAGAVFAAIADPRRVERWWGPEGFTNSIHEFDFVAGGRWLLTMHGPDGTNYPNESRFTRIEPGRLVEIEHLNGHHFFLTLELTEQGSATRLDWRQCFDTDADYARLATFVAKANEQNLDRLAAEVSRGG